MMMQGELVQVPPPPTPDIFPLPMPRSEVMEAAQSRQDSRGCCLHTAGREHSQLGRALLRSWSWCVGW